MSKKGQNILAAVIGLVLIVVAVTLLVIKECPTPAIFFAERILLALGVGCLGYLITGNITYEGSIQGTGPVLKATGPMVLFIAIYFLNPPALLGANTDCNDTIEINGKVLIDGHSVEGVGIKVLELEQQRLTNMFGVFPAFHVSKKNHPAALSFSIQLKSADPSVVGIDTTIVFKTDSVLKKNIEIRLHQPLPSKTLAGHVLDDKGKALGKVKVSAANSTATTDDAGYFSFKVQTTETSIPLKFEKEKYQPRTLTYNVPNDAISISLTRIQTP